jgi:hypothetical protein
MDSEVKMGCVVVITALLPVLWCVCVCLSQLMRVHESIGCRLHSTLSNSIWRETEREREREKESEKDVNVVVFFFC